MKHESSKLITHPMIQSAKFFLFFVPFSLFLMSSCHESSLKIVTVTVTSSEGQSTDWRMLRWQVQQPNMRKD